MPSHYDKRIGQLGRAGSKGKLTAQTILPDSRVSARSATPQLETVSDPVDYVEAALTPLSLLGKGGNLSPTGAPIPTPRATVPTPRATVQLGPTPRATVQLGPVPNTAPRGHLSRAGRLISGLGRKALFPLELALLGAEGVALATDPEAREEARQDVLTMATEPTKWWDRAIKGMADPLKVSYGLAGPLAELYDTRFDVAEGNRRIEAEVLRRKRREDAAAAKKEGRLFLDPDRDAPLPRPMLSGPTPEMMRILREETQKREMRRDGGNRIEK
tara:strand:+ start:865 stop:1683 length:819 start_codon:yes stop_codon:yes gene_type:complete